MRTHTDSLIRLFALALAGLCIASVLTAGPRVNPRKGKVFFKNNCRTCHDGATADVKELQPIGKTMEQWTRDFAEGGAVASCVPRVKEKTGTELTAQDLLDMQAYLVQHAADSDQPATCGQD